jgi:hypothetical protein
MLSGSINRSAKEAPFRGFSPVPHVTQLLFLGSVKDRPRRAGFGYLRDLEGFDPGVSSSAAAAARRILRIICPLCLISVECE